MGKRKTQNIFVLCFSANPIKKCQGKFIRQICHLSLKDLKEIDDRNRLNNGKPNCYVANKVQ